MADAVSGLLALLTCLLMGGLFEVGDVVTPQQFLDEIRRSSDRTPEQRLMHALLSEALQCFFGNARGAAKSRPDRQQDAVLWVRGREPALLSFVDVCGALEIDADTLCAELFRRLQQQRRGLASLPHLPRHRYRRQVPLVLEAAG